jgi:hypothetical protein
VNRRRDYDKKTQIEGRINDPEAGKFGPDGDDQGKLPAD